MRSVCCCIHILHVDVADGGVGVAHQRELQVRAPIACSCDDHFACSNLPDGVSVNVFGGLLQQVRACGLMMKSRLRVTTSLSAGCRCQSVCHRRSAPCCAARRCAPPRLRSRSNAASLHCRADEEVWRLTVYNIALAGSVGRTHCVFLVPLTK
jgi:hypothetical protein